VSGLRRYLRENFNASCFERHEKILVAFLKAFNVNSTPSAEGHRPFQDRFMKTILARAVARRSEQSAGFTFVDLLVVIAVIAILVCVRLSAFASAQDRTRAVQCADNLRQFTTGTLIYAGENNGNLPDNVIGSWSWDMPWDAGNAITRFVSWKALYCPASGFDENQNDELWNYNYQFYHVIGYALTFPGSATLDSTNVNHTITPQAIIVGPGKYFTPAASERVLFADAIVSKPNQRNESLRDIYDYTNIPTGFYQPFRTSHLNGVLPAGGNLAMLDGHVEWRVFDKMHVRTSSFGLPTFWW
jgi:prepilin-type processing-associated H-X9-DG protein